MKKMIAIIFLTIGIGSCKKEEKASPLNAIAPKCDTITYKAYGDHSWYEIDYMEKGAQYHLNSSASLRNWTYTFIDTVGAHKRLVYQSSTESDTMTAIIIVNGIVTDSITQVGANMSLTLNR